MSAEQLEVDSRASILTIARVSGNPRKHYHALGALGAYIARRVTAENVRRRAAGEPPLRLRVGIHSRPAIVGNIGAPGRVNYTLIGDTVNIAQRLEALGKETSRDAEVAVLLSADTRSALDAGFAVEPLGPFVLRGRDDPLEVYRLQLSEGGAQRP